MLLLDTLDAALMLTLYTSPAFAKDPIAVLYYSLVLTVVTVLVAVVIGSIQLLTLVSNVIDPAPRGRFWEGLKGVGAHWDGVGELSLLFLLNFLCFSLLHFLFFFSLSLQFFLFPYLYLHLISFFPSIFFLRPFNK